MTLPTDCPVNPAVNPATTTTKTQRCQPCGGAGIIEAGGFMKKDCNHCNGSGTIKIIEADIDFLLAKSTEAYQGAKEKIKALDDKLTDSQAEALLDAGLAGPEEKPEKSAKTTKEGAKHGKAIHHR